MQVRFRSANAPLVRTSRLSAREIPTDRKNAYVAPVRLSSFRIIARDGRAEKLHCSILSRITLIGAARKSQFGARSMSGSAFSLSSRFMRQPARKRGDRKQNESRHALDASTTRRPTRQRNPIVVRPPALFMQTPGPFYAQVSPTDGKWLPISPAATRQKRHHRVYAHTRGGFRAAGIFSRLAWRHPLACMTQERKMRLPCQMPVRSNNAVKYRDGLTTLAAWNMGRTTL